MPRCVSPAANQLDILGQGGGCPYMAIQSFWQTSEMAYSLTARLGNLLRRAEVVISLQGQRTFHLLHVTMTHSQGDSDVGPGRSLHARLFFTSMICVLQHEPLGASALRLIGLRAKPAPSATPPCRSSAWGDNQNTGIFGDHHPEA